MTYLFFENYSKYCTVCKFRISEIHRIMRNKKRAHMILFSLIIRVEFHQRHYGLDELRQRHQSFRLSLNHFKECHSRSLCHSVA